MHTGTAHPDGLYVKECYFKSFHVDLSSFLSISLRAIAIYSTGMLIITS
jgi:hypothetical protein